MDVVQYGATTEWLNVFLEVSRRFEASLATSVQLTVTQYRILLELDATSMDVRSVDLARMLLLRPSSITTALGHLEKRGYVVRRTDPLDRRATLIAITPAGKRTEVGASAELVTVRRKLWRALSDRQVQAVVESTRLASERLKATTSVTMGTLIEPFYTTCVMTVIALFGSAVKKECSLSLTEFRILAELLSSGSKSRGSDLAARLFLDESVISVAIRKLSSASLVAQWTDETDRRNRILSLTEKGARLAQKGREAVTRVNQKIYGNLDEALIVEVARAAIIINDSI